MRTEKLKRGGVNIEKKINFFCEILFKRGGGKERRPPVHAYAERNKVRAARSPSPPPPHRNRPSLHRRRRLYFCLNGTFCFDGDLFLFYIKNTAVTFVLTPFKLTFIIKLQELISDGLE